MESHGPQSSPAAAEEAETVLPHEVLVTIFGRLRDGFTLLDTLPLVCERWRRAARDPAAWASVEIVVTYDLFDGARLLLHAPASKSLVVHACPRYRGSPEARRHAECMFAPGGLYGPEERRRLRSALRRTRAVVRDSVCMTQNGCRMIETDEPSTDSSAAPFLARQRGLRALRLHLDSKDDGGALLAAVSSLHSLRMLELTMGQYVSYMGQLADALSELRELRVHGEVPRQYMWGADLDVPKGIVGDLVRGAPRLELLEVDMPRGVDLEACAALRVLQHVKLNVYRDCRRRVPAGEAVVRAVRKAGRLLLRVANPALRTAAVSVCNGEDYEFSFFSKEDCIKALEDLTVPLGVEVDLDMQVESSGCYSDCDADCPRCGWRESDSDGEDECHCRECPDA